MSVGLEVCVDSLESVEKVIDIVQQGSNRFEVCSNLIHGGGLTPSIGLVNTILRKYPGTRIMAMIRPRIGSFVYTDSELEVMVADITAFKATGVMGVVFGCLTEEGEVDMPAVQRLATAAAPLEITFHRAFDVAHSIDRSLRDIAAIDGITRILTSGRETAIGHGFESILELSGLCAGINQAGRKRSLAILPGSGISADVVALFRVARPNWKSSRLEVHLTGSKRARDRAGRSGDQGEEYGFGACEKWVLDRVKVEAVWEELKRWA